MAPRISPDGMYECDEWDIERWHCPLKDGLRGDVDMKMYRECFPKYYTDCKENPDNCIYKRIMEISIN